MEMYMKAKGQQNQPKAELLAHTSPCSSVRIELPAANGKVVSSSLTRGTRLVSPAGSCYYQQGLASGEPKAGLLRSTVILRPMPEESKAQSDVPFMQNRDGKGRKGTQRCSALEVPAMRQAVLSTTPDTIWGRRTAPAGDRVPNPPLPR